MKDLKLEKLENLRNLKNFENFENLINLKKLEKLENSKIHITLLAGLPSFSLDSVKSLPYGVCWMARS